MAENTAAVLWAKEERSEIEYPRMAGLQWFPFLLVKYTGLQIGTNIQPTNLEGEMNLLQRSNEYTFLFFATSKQVLQEKNT